MNRAVLVRVSTSVLVLAGAWMAYTQNPPPAQNLINIASDLYMIDGGSNAVFYITGEGVIVIDDKFERDFDAILAKIKSVTGEPVKYVLNTHHHGDHTGGNPRFLPFAEIISHVNSRINHIELKQPAPPRVVFDKEMSVFLGGKEVRAIYYGRGHTNGDVMIYFPQLKILHTGDLMAGNSPLVDYAAGGSLVEYARTLDGPMNLEFETVIQGHGPLVKRAGYIQYRDGVEKFRAQLTGLVRAGKSKDDVAKFLIAEYGWVPNGLPMQRSLDGFMSELK
jgi:cyclase